jgi:hypothetical protein
MSTSNPQVCENQSCSVCGILRNGFLLDKSLSNTGWGRFGRGLYFTSVSSKSYDYSKPNAANVRAIFVAYVVVGNGKKLSADAPSLTSPGQGYHSVLGVVGSVLNFDEVVTYQNNSALPGYLILLQ